MTILTINAWDLPFVTKDKGKRLQTLIASLQQLSPDIVCMQEIWEMNVREKIGRVLFEYQVPPMCFKRRLFMLDRTGGLVTFVKNGIEVGESKFLPFQENGLFCLEDWLGKKGFFITVLELGEQRVVLVNTHLHVRMLGAYHHHQSVRTSQIRQVLDAVLGEPNVILAGDFNCEPGTEEYRMFLDAGYGDVTKEIEVTTNHYHSVHLNRFLVPHQRKIDYFFVKTTNHVILRNTRAVFTEEFVSDHNGIMAEIVIR